jgi:hypothetical protein
VTRWLFWFLLGVNVLFSLLVFAALPYGPDLIYAVQASSLLGALIALGAGTMGPPSDNGSIT